MAATATSAAPIYNSLFDQAKALELDATYAMVIPVALDGWWQGLDKFREAMLADKRIRSTRGLPEALRGFSGRDDCAAAFCYFLWDREHDGRLRGVTNDLGRAVTGPAVARLSRWLMTFSFGDNEAVPILEKIVLRSAGKAVGRLRSRSERRSAARKPFGLRTFFREADETHEEIP